ncbi:MAG: MarR family transcriptional regulator [Dehalococcoidia bacterium]|nr:MarR family transcriptional regulator [Dehalococcoidia bacterium]
MSGTVRLNEDEKTWERIFRTSGALYRLREMELDRVGLSLSQAAALYFLKTSPEPLTPMKISRLIHKQPHTTAALLRRMESRGLIKRTRDLHRKNWVRVSLTRKGEAAFQRQMSERTAMNITSRLSRDDVAVLNRILRQLHDAAVELICQMKPTPYDSPFL